MESDWPEFMEKFFLKPMQNVTEYGIMKLYAPDGART